MLAAKSQPSVTELTVRKRTKKRNMMVYKQSSLMAGGCMGCEVCCDNADKDKNRPGCVTIVIMSGKVEYQICLVVGWVW